MSPGASSFHRSEYQRSDGPGGAGVLWPSVVAILFATLATISFAVDQGVTLSTVSELLADNPTR